MRRTIFRIRRQFTTEIGRTGESGVSIQLDKARRDFSLTQDAQTDSGAHTISCWMFSVILSRV